MAIITLQTTTNPFSGESFETAIDYEFDQSRIVYPTLTPQSPNSNKAKFQYRTTSSMDSLPFDTAQYSWVFVDNTVEEVVNGPNPAPVGLTINYVDPINGVGTFTTQGQISTQFQLSTPDVGTQIWTIENIVNPTGSGSIQDQFDTGSDFYFNWTKGNPTSAGTVTFNVKLTIGAASVTKPCSVIITL
jgi:hypothetical protein